MKIFVVLCLVGVATAEVSLHAVLQAKWSNFKATHNKAYEPHEEQQRLNAYLENSLDIENHNERFAKGLETYSRGHNHLTDMTNEEYQRTMLGGLPMEMPENVTTYQMQPMATMPSGCDWRHTTPVVKNQGSCGSCYTFAAIGSLEGQWARKHNQVLDLSEQNLLDCTGALGNMGCNGGWSYKCFQYVQQAGGVYLQRDYPYVGYVAQCRNVNGARYTRVSNFVAVNNQQAMINAVTSVGPVAVSIDSSLRSFMSYQNGIYSDAECGRSGNTNHLVVVVGHGVANNICYFVVKNSWGNGWGEGGYMRMRCDLCLVSRWGFYPVV